MDALQILKLKRFARAGGVAIICYPENADKVEKALEEVARYPHESASAIAAWFGLNIDEGIIS